MSSGEKAKPPGTFEERNPFDISRRSGPEVAAEIAKRMVAWKQARSRTTHASTNQSATNQSTTIPSGDAKLPPPIAAPVQPARMPKAARGSQPAQATTAPAGAGNTAPRVPYFAASATRRAMPPAPSLKQARPSAPGNDERTVRADEPSIAPTAPVVERSTQDQDERPIQAADVMPAPEAPAAEARPTASAMEETNGMAAATTQPEASRTHPFELPSGAEASEAMPAEPDERERRRAEARAIKARWIAARDLDALLERPAADAAADESPKAQARDSQSSEQNLVRSPSEKPLANAASEPDTEFEATAQVDEPRATPTEPELEPEAQHTIPIAARGKTVGRQIFGAAVAATSKTVPAADRDQGRERQALDAAALEQAAEIGEPTFDISRTVPETFDATPESHIEAPDAMVAPLRAEPVAAEAPDLTAASADATDQGALSIAALDSVAGRKEPTFDPPVQSSSGILAEGTSEPQDEASSASVARAAVKPAPVPSPAPVLSARDEAAEELPALSVDALDEVAGRKEPTFDAPIRPAVAAAAPAATQKAPHIKLRPIETRIEARRMGTLRADPQMAVRRPIFPHIEPEEWDVPPVVAARAQRDLRGSGWAIGLGSLLLIAGITAPAAIWQQGRQEQDQAALVTPVPATQPTAATPGSSTSGAPSTGASTAQAPARVTSPAAPQPEAPAVTAQQSSAPVEPKPEAEEGGTPPATQLSDIGESDDVNEAPVVAPPPMVNLASKTGPASAGTPMVARPFVPQQGDGPFLRAPTTGAASVPVGTPQPGAQPVGTGVKPNLIGQLKPKSATVASPSKPVASKPRAVQRQAKPFFQQSPDQMFETLIETLSEGRPVNHNTKPASPSNRR